MPPMQHQLVKIKADSVYLDGMLSLPENAHGLILFAHGRDSNRLSPRNNFVAERLQQAQIGTLLIDLLTKSENQIETARFNITLLTRRLYAVCNWIEKNNSIAGLPLGLFGASTGAAAVLHVAATHSRGIAAIVSRGGRPDLAGHHVLQRITTPTLLIVGSRDSSVLEINQQAYALLTCRKRLEIIPGATHLFEESGALDKVARVSVSWFRKYMIRSMHD